jgi:hypothetical protein
LRAAADRREFATVGQHGFTGVGVDGGDGRLELEVDAVLSVEVGVAKRHPLFRRVAGEVILRQIGPIDGRRIVVAQHHDAALELLTAQHLRRGKTGRAAADDDDPLRLGFRTRGAAR